MFIIKKNADGTFTEVVPFVTTPSLVNSDGATSSWDVIYSWSDAELQKEFNLYKVKPFVVPEGKETVGNPFYTEVNNIVTQNYYLKDIPVQVASPETLAEAKIRLCDKVDNSIGITRAKYITTITGQNLIYEAKRRESTNYLSDVNPLNSNYPFMSASLNAEVDGSTMTEIANLWKTKNSNWEILCSQLEVMRLNAKKNIKNSLTISDAELIFDNFETALSAFK